MGCDKPENLPDPTSFHTFDDLSLSIRQSGAVDYNGVVQGGFSSGANVTSFPFVSPPAARPLPGNVNEMNNFQMANLKNLYSYHHQLETNLANVTNIAPSFPAPSRMPNSMGNAAEIYQSNMNNNMLTSDSFLNEAVLSKGIQNPGVSVNFMPMRSNAAGCFEKAGKATGINQISSQASGTPFDIGYSMQTTKSICGIGIHNDVKANPVPFSSPENIDGSFLTLGTGSNIDNRSKFRFSAKEVSSRLGEAVLSQSNNSHVQQMKRNISSLAHGVPGGIPNSNRDSGGLPNLARNFGVSTCSSNNDEIVLAPGSRISAPPCVNLMPDTRLNSSNSTNLVAVGKADLRFSEPDPFKCVQGGLPPPSLQFSSSSTLPPHLGYARTVAAPESAQPVWVAAAPLSAQPGLVTAQPTIKQQSNCYTNISRNQSFMEPLILGHGGSGVRQDHLGPQSLVNVPHPWGNNLFPERMGAHIAGWSGIQPAPDNLFPKRLGVQLNDGVISQATREGVLPGMGGIQQIRKGNSYQSRDHGPTMHPTGLLHPPLAMGQPHGGSAAKYNVTGLPYHSGQGIPISKVDATPQASNIHAHVSLKRRANGAPPIALMCQRRRTLAQHRYQQLIAQRESCNASVPASSPSLPLMHVKCQETMCNLFLHHGNVHDLHCSLAFPQVHPGGHSEESAQQPIGEKCLLCKRDVAFNPEGPVSRPAVPPAVAVLPCGHVFHDHCLQIITPEDQSKIPPCIPCALGET